MPTFGPRTAHAVASLVLFPFLMTAAQGAERSIPLSTIITTSPQSGLQSTKSAFPQDSSDNDSLVANRFLRQILQNYRSGTSNAFLVDAAVPRYAITATSKVLLGSRPALEAVQGNPAANIDVNYWLVVSLGSAASDLQSWQVNSVKVEAERVVLDYQAVPTTHSKPKRSRYLYWIPLGPLESGHYQVELFDSSQQATTLLRRIAINASPEGTLAATVKP